MNKKLRYDEWMNISKRHSALTIAKSLEIYNEKHVMETRSDDGEIISRIIKIMNDGEDERAIILSRVY